MDLSMFMRSMRSSRRRCGNSWKAARHFCSRTRRPLLLFDSMEALAARWGMRTAGDFFGRCCPMLLDLGAIAYWSVPGAGSSAAGFVTATPPEPIMPSNVG